MLPPFPDRPLPVRRPARAAAIVVAVALALAGCSDEPDTRSASDQSSSSDGSSPPKPSKSDEPTAEPDQETSEEPSEEPAGTAIPVYWVGDGAGGRLRLFREFQRVEGDPLTEAATLVAGGGQATDPDYRTLWPQVEISAVTPTDGVLLVEIPSDGFTERPDGMSRRQARLAVQQLVYTLQGVQQERVPVLIQREGGLPLFGLPTDAPFQATSALQTLNLVNITSPAEGETVTGDTLTVTGVANSFEASGPCRLVVGGEEVALEAYQSDGWMEDKLFPFEVELPLEGVNGEAVVQCETDDPSGGAEGDGPSIDTKTIRIG